MWKHNNKPGGRARRWISNLLLFVAILAIGVWVWSELREAVYENRDEVTFDRKQRTRPPAESKRAKPPVAARGDLVARLSIPRIHLRAMVREGADEDTLGVGLGHISGTAFPGQTGNVGVAGHRDTLFRRLGEIGKNDLIQLQSISASYVYRVDDISIVKPQTVSVLNAGSRPQLTLVTCYPFRYVGSAPDRYIVKAHLVSQTPLPPAKSLSSADADLQRDRRGPRAELQGGDRDQR
jgi:sortase A